MSIQDNLGIDELVHRITPTQIESVLTAITSVDKKKAIIAHLNGKQLYQLLNVSSNVPIQNRIYETPLTSSQTRQYAAVVNETIDSLTKDLDEAREQVIALEQKLEETKYDELTGLPNRRSINEYLSHRITDFTRIAERFFRDIAYKSRTQKIPTITEETSLMKAIDNYMPNIKTFEKNNLISNISDHTFVTQTTVGYSDLDGFKTINDRFGHAAGDKIIKIMADSVR